MDIKGRDSGVDSRKLKSAGLLIALGIVFGAIGTSPLYVINAVAAWTKGDLAESLILGVLSCIFWTLTIIATFKYLVLTLEADNKGEGGIFALYASLRKKTSLKALLLIAGGSAMLATGIIAPSITLTSSVEGFETILPSFPVIPVVLGIFLIFFLVQRFMPGFIGNTSGPVLALWFSMTGFIGIMQLVQHPAVLAALNPIYAVRFLVQYPGGFILAGVAFLSVAGAESFFQELGKYSKSNIRILWIFVKIILVVSYFGQGAWLLDHNSELQSTNPFFAIMPQWLILPGIIISLFASLVACHSMVGRSFTLVSEAVSLNFWPNIKILHPTQFKGQVYLPLINWIFWLASTIFVIIFRRSSDMVAAYGLAVIIVMITTTLLLIIYYRQYKKGKRAWLAIVPVVLIIETSFFVSITYGFASSIWFSLIIISLSVLIMIGWYFGRKIKNRYITFANLSDYTSLLIDLHNDKSVPMIATNLVYIIKANRMDQVESKVIYSIFKRQPKRAETYWFLHVDRTDEPERFDYEFNPIIPGVLHRIDFHIGFKVEPRINLYFREVLDDLVHSGEINLTSSFNSLRKFNFTGDFKYILIDRVMLRDNKLSALENFILSLHGLTRWLDITDERALHLDLTNTIVEKIPVTLEQPPGQRITRIK